jgi:hypothetical protein
MQTERRVARVGPTTPKQVESGKRTPVDGDKHIHSRGDARLLLGCFGRSDRSAQLSIQRRREAVRNLREGVVVVIPGLRGDLLISDN